MKKEIKLKIDSNKVAKFLVGILLVLGTFFLIKYLLFPLALSIIALLYKLILMYPLLNINVQFGALVLLIYFMASIIGSILDFIIFLFNSYNKYPKDKKTEKKR